MKRQIISYLTIAIIGVLSSCDRDLETEGISRITYFPDLTMEGEPIIFVEEGDPYTDAGASAKEGEESIEVGTSISGSYFEGNVASINTTDPDTYNITYSATNSDGYPGLVSRTVYVAGKGNFVDDISGLYTSTVIRNGVTGAQYTDMGYVIVRKTGASTYLLSDVIGGYYDLGRGFGPAYAGPSSTITANDLSTNDFTFGPSVGIGAFGGIADITEMQINATEKTIHLKTDWDAGPYTFDVTLTQVDF